MRNQKGVMLAVFCAVVVLAACQPPSAPTPPAGPVVIVNQVNGPNNSGNGSTTPGADAACAGITGTPALSVFAGTFSGGKGKVSEPLHLRITGLSVPTTCNPVLDVTASGSCSRLGSVHTVSEITVLPTAPGPCTVTACISAKCAANTTDVIE